MTNPGTPTWKTSVRLRRTRLSPGNPGSAIFFCFSPKIAGVQETNLTSRGSVSILRFKYMLITEEMWYALKKIA